MGFNFLALARFFCMHFRVSDVWKIDPRQGRTEAWTLMSRPGGVGVEPRTLALEVGSVLKEGSEQNIETFRFQLNGDARQQVVRCPLVSESPRCRFMTKPASMGDTQHVCLLNVVTRNIWSSMPIRMVARFPFYPVGDGGKREALDRLEAEAGAVPGAYLEFGNTPKQGQDVERLPVEERLDHGFLNRFFVASMALVTEGNLRNGVVPIPRAVCLDVGLPVFKGPPPPPSGYDGDPQTWNEHWLKANAGEHHIQMFYALPVNHVLAWGLRSEAFAAKRKLPSLRFQFVPPPHAGMGDKPLLLYYLVADLHFEGLVREVQRVWMGKVDMRPLSALSFELYPMCNKRDYPDLPQHVEVVGGVVALRSYLTYLAPEPGAVNDQIIAQLIPTLCPGFPEPDGWEPYSQEELTFIDGAVRHGGGGASAFQRTK